ncbi:MAG: 50S ribosomal protein L10 [Candidatus Baldrarchaeia archaeon]
MAIAVTRQGRPVPEHKVKIVNELVELIKKYKVIALTKMEGIGALQVQRLRNMLRGRVLIKMAKNTLMKIALNKAKKFKPGIEKLADHVIGSCAFVFTNENPVKINLFLGKNKAKAPAKAGQLAQNDIIVPEGNTGLPPGPVISELNEVGIPTRVQSGSVWVAKDTVVCKKGEKISRKLALVLSRLGIEPMEVGLSLHAAYDDGIIFTEEELTIHPEEIKQQIQTAHIEALNLSINAYIPTPDTIPILLQKAHNEAFNLSINAYIPTKETLPYILSKAHAEATTLASKILEIKPDALPSEIITTIPRPAEAAPAEEAKEEKKEEKKEEEEEEELGLGSLFG